MKKQIRQRIFRYGILLIGAVLLAIAIEVFFNSKSFSQGYGYENLLPEVSTENDGLVISKTFEAPRYVKKLLLDGNFNKNPYYKIQLTVENEFGAEEIVELEDRANSVWNQAFTNIGYDVKSMKIIFDDAGLVQLQSVSISNQVQFSQYRILFFSLLFFLLALILIERQMILRHLEYFYVVAAIGFGVLLNVASGPEAVTWDEEAHYRSAYTASYGENINIDQAAESNFARVPITVNTGEERILLERYMDNLSDSAEMEKVISNAGVGLRQRIIYFPMSLFLWVSRVLGLSFSLQYAAGRIGNLLICVLLNFFAIRLAVKKKVIIAVIAMLPTLIFQSCMLTYDGSIWGSLTLGTVLCLNAAQGTEKKEAKRNFILALPLFLWGILAKPVYLPFLLLLWFPLRNTISFCSEKQKTFIKKLLIVVGCVSILAVLGIAICVIVSIVRGNFLVAADVRGGASDVGAQLASILQHPAAFLKMLLRDMFSMDNFRNFGDPSKNRNMASNLMFLNLYVLGILKDAWSLLLIPLLTMVFFVSPENEKDSGPTGVMRLTTAAVLLFSAILIWLSMYLFFTPVGEGAIQGVQARYFLPLLFPLAILVWNRKFNLKISELSYRQVVLAATLLLTGVCVYQGCIVGRVV